MTAESELAGIIEFSPGQNDFEAWQYEMVARCNLAELREDTPRCEANSSLDKQEGFGTMPIFVNVIQQFQN